MNTPVHITAFYAFVPVAAGDLERLRADVRAFGASLDLRGLVLLATEGINGTVSGSADAIAQWKTFVRGVFGEMTFKDSTADEQVFRRWSVKIKPEIVGIKRDAIKPAGKHRHLSPQEWHEMLGREDVVVVDARNSYEIAIGTFPGAVDPGTRAFHEFPDAVRAANIPKDKKVLMCCTGGIRCEKAIFAMEEQGYHDVYQLDGGILAYLEQFPDGKFDGECFVFDHRVAVDSRLRPSKTYVLCPHCGDPAEHSVDCTLCKKTAKICGTCLAKGDCEACSKDCRFRLLAQHEPVRS